MAVEAKKDGFNTIQVNLTNGVALVNSPRLPLETAWSKEKFRSWSLGVQSIGLEIIPELKLLAHQAKFFQNRYQH